MFPGIDMEAIKALPADERVLLAHAILETVTAEAEAYELTDEDKAELDRRIAEAEANPDDAIPWEQVLAESLARAKK